MISRQFPRFEVVIIIKSRRSDRLFETILSSRRSFDSFAARHEEKRTFLYVIVKDTKPETTVAFIENDFRDRKPVWRSLSPMSGAGDSSNHLLPQIPQFSVPRLKKNLFSRAFPLANAKQSFQAVPLLKISFVAQKSLTQLQQDFRLFR